VCGRYVSATSAERLAEEFRVDEVKVEDLGARYNVAPTLDVYAVATASDGERRLGSLRWGLVPGFAKDPSIGNRMINLRTDTVMSRPAFTRLLAHRRCLVPADGFYEWQRREAVPPATKPTKQPFYITSAAGTSLAFAGLWDRWTPREASTDASAAAALRTVTLVTGEPNELVARIHDRMVVMIPAAKWDAWLDPSTDASAAAALLVPVASDALRAYPVTSAVNNVRNDGAELLDPLPGHDPG